MKRPSPIFLLLIALGAMVIVVAVGTGMTLLHFQTQRELQHQWAWTDDTTLNSQSHWLEGWVPAGFHKYLPGQELELHFKGNDGLDDGTKVAMELSSIYGLQYDDCDLLSIHWELAARNRSLRWIWLEDSPIDDQKLGLLQKHKQLEWIYIENSLITDASLAPLGALPALREVVLHDTKVSVAAIKQFAAANPQITVTYSPRLTEQQRKLKDELHKVQIEAGPNQDSGIVKAIRWKVVFNEACTLEHMQQVRSLGVVDEVIFWESTDLATINEIANWPSLQEVEWKRIPTADNIRQIAKSTKTRRLRFDFAGFPISELNELKKQYGDRIVDHDIFLPFTEAND